MSEELKKVKTRAIDDCVLDFLSEFAEYLVGAGMSYPRLNKLVRIALYRAAASRAMLRNKRLNQSALAAISGLTRVQVRQFARQSQANQLEIKDRLAVVVEGWAGDSAYQTPKGTPKPLRTSGLASSFAALVRKYGGDVSARSMLHELERHGYVTCRNGLVALKRSVLQSREELRLIQTSRVLQQFLKSTATSGVVSVSDIKVWTGEARYPAISEKGKAILNRRIAANLRSFLSAVEAMGEAASADSPPRRQTNRVTRTKVVLVAEDFTTLGVKSAAKE